jgi:hypothetical protein
MVKMISDGAGGAIVTWRDQSPLAPASIGAQRISPGGTLLWGASGVEICSGSGPSPTNPCLASDGSGGAIITWQDARLGSSNVDIYAQKVNSAGTLQWTTNGITISTAAGNQVEPCIATHGVGDVLAVWTDTRNGSTPDIYAQHFTAGGALPIQLASFTAHYIASCGSVLLEWTTVTELNNFGFRIQRRIASSSEFETLPNVFIPGHGTTTELHHYSFTDSTVSPAGWWYRLNQIDLDGTSHYSDPVPVEIPTNVEGSDMPKQFWLSQNHPNPFNPTTTIEFSIAKRTHVRIAVYDILGREVSTLIDETKDTGTHRVTWDASDASSGVYFYTIQSREFVATRKMLVLK